jgi:hypothetical protein
MLNLGITGFGNDLVVAWRGFGNDEGLYYSVNTASDGSFDIASWGPPTQIPGVGSSWGPSLCEFNGRLYAAWKGTAGNALWYSSFDGSSWAPQALIPWVGSSVGPSLAVFDGRLYAAWMGADGDQSLWYSSFDGSSWAPQAQIPGVASNFGPSLAEWNGVLYAAWRGTGTDQSMYYSSFDGSGWAPQAQIPYAASSVGPTLRVGFGNQLYVVWKGIGDDTQLYYSSSGGSGWAPQAQIPGAASSVGASLTAFNDKLYAVWSTVPQYPEGSGGPWTEQLDYTQFDGSSWAPPVMIPGTYTDVQPSKYVYTIQLAAGGFLGGKLEMAFYPFGANTATTPPLATFTGGFGGAFAGDGAGGGTAWLNYDVEWLAQQGWNARFEANFIPPAANVNLWALSGEVIGNTVAGGVLIDGGVVGGQGYFGS